MSRTKKTETTETAETTVEAAAETAEETTETTVTKTKAATKTAAAEETATKTETKLMYVGPTLTGIAIQNRVYTEIPETAAEMIAKDAELRNLFIPISQYPKANKMIREQTGYIYRAYTKALKLKK